VTSDSSGGWQKTGWFRQVGIDDCLSHFKDWIWDWIDVPALLKGGGYRVREPHD
jgi:hypothetical protein